MYFIFVFPNSQKVFNHIVWFCFLDCEYPFGWNIILCFDAMIILSVDLDAQI